MTRAWWFIPAAVMAVAGTGRAIAQTENPQPEVPPQAAPATQGGGTNAAWAGAVVEMHSARRSGVVSAWLRNGVLVHHRMMEQPKGLVVITLSFAGAEVLETADNRGISLLAAAAIDKLWSCKMEGKTPAQLVERLELHAEAGAAPDAIVLRLWGPASAAESGLAAIRSVIECPRVIPEEFPGMKDRVGAMLREWTDSERGVVWEAVVNSMFPACESRVRAITPAQLERLTPEAVQAWLDRHAASAPIEASIVGDIPLERALRLAAEFLATLPARDRVSPRTYADLRVIPEVHAGVCAGGAAQGAEFVHVTPDNKSFVVSGFYGRGVTDVREHRTMRVISGILDGRMTARLAEEGLLPEDGVSVNWVQSSVYPGFGRVVASVMAEPEQAAKVRETLAQVLAESSRRPITSGELADSCNRLAQTVETLEKDPSYWARLLARCRAWGLDPEAMIGGASFYRTLRQAEVEEVLARHCTDANRIEILIRPAPAHEDPAPIHRD